MAILKNKLTLGLLAVAAIAGLLYWWSGKDSAPILTQEPQLPLSTDLLAVLGSLNTIHLDDAFFADQVFQSLTDFGVTIPPQATGRRNPFEPI
ncbi:MAG: hypothetical protein AAB964_01000 [Patescibacteria group bacterium]